MRSLFLGAVVKYKDADKFLYNKYRRLIVNRSVIMIEYIFSFVCSVEEPRMSDDLAEGEEAEDYSVFENKTGLAEDMKFLASMPELCDVTFLVGDTREPVCAVKAVLAARSR